MNLSIKKIELEDCEIICKAFKLQNWYKPVSQFEKYFNYQKEGIRDVIMASLENEFAGYLTIAWES